MKTWERWSFGVLALVVTASGLAYLWMKYFVVNDDPFAVVNHPWQGAMLALHVVSAPGLILTFGILLNSHVTRRIAAGTTPNRRSGLTSLTTFFAMTATGYLLQVATSEALLQALVWLHVSSGIVFATSYAAHLMISVRLLRGQTVRRWRSESV